MTAKGNFVFLVITNGDTIANSLRTKDKLMEKNITSSDIVTYDTGVRKLTMNNIGWHFYA